MAKYIIWNRTQNKFVAEPGLKSSFTTSALKARRFTSYEAAEKDCCGDEMVVNLSKIIGE